MGKASRLKKQRKILEGMGINVRRKAKERKTQQEQIKELDKSDDEICSFIDTEQVVLIKKMDIVLDQSGSRIQVLLIL
jgi:cytidylate kinase